MATRRLLVHKGLLPDSSGNVYWDSSVNRDTNDRFPHQPLAFKDSATKDKATGSFVVPDDYVQSAELELEWCTTLADNTKGVRWEVAYRTIAGDDTDSIDPSTDEEVVGGTDSVSATTLRRMIATLTLTGGNFAASETVLFAIARDGTSGADTAAATVWIESIRFKYANT